MKVWYDSENEVAFLTKEIAIESAKTYLEKLTCGDIEVKKISNSQYVISGVRAKGIHIIERVYIFEIPVYETSKEFIETLCDDDMEF